MASKKGTRSMSWLELSTRQKNLHKEHFHWITVDYEKYVCTDSTIVMKMIREMWFSWELDTDNSNIEHIKSDSPVSLEHWRSDLGTTYKVMVALPGFKPFQAFSFESYYENRVKVLKSEWGIEFPGAFFKFRDKLREQAPEIMHFYDRLRRLAFPNVPTGRPQIFRRNRCDIAIDIKLPVDQKWEYEYIVPSPHSKKVVHHYNFKKELWGWQSFSFMPSNNRWIWIRVYNKCRNIIDLEKQSWYPEINPETDTLTRIELVYYSPYSENPDDVLLAITLKAILWLDTDVTLCEVFSQPESKYHALTAHIYFSRYAKNHWQELITILNDVTLIEYQKNQ